jgi:hydrogenase maturation protein HypF
MKDAGKTAACFLLKTGLEDYIRDERKELIKAAVTNRVNTVLTSSMGRLFDAVSSILNIAHMNRYEGECASLLEKEAVLAERRLSEQNLETAALTAEKRSAAEHKETAVEYNKDQLMNGIRDWMKQEGLSFGIHLADNLITKDDSTAVQPIADDDKPAAREAGADILIDPGPVLAALCRLRDTVDTGILALSFHYAVADMITEVSIRIRDNMHSNVVALCGGVFQNTVLTEQAMELLEKEGFRVYVNEAVPPNDGSISLGQTYLGLMQ